MLLFICLALCNGFFFLCQMLFWSITLPFHLYVLAAFGELCVVVLALIIFTGWTRGGDASLPGLEVMACMEAALAGLGGSCVAFLDPEAYTGIWPLIPSMVCLMSYAVADHMKSEGAPFPLWRLTLMAMPMGIGFLWGIGELFLVWRRKAY